MNFTIDDPFEGSSFRRIWIVAFVVALLSAPLVVYLKDEMPWVIAIPISIGAILILVFEMWDYMILTRRDDSLRVKLQGILEQSRSPFFYYDAERNELVPEEIADVPIRDVASNFWLELRREKKPSPKQLDLFERIVTEGASRRKVRVLPTEEGDIYAINSDRFLELLVSKLLVNADKATEHALALAWKRHHTPQLTALLNKIVRETIKNDLRGTLLKLVSDGGGWVIDDLLKTVRAEEKQNVEGAAKSVSN